MRLHLLLPLITVLRVAAMTTKPPGIQQALGPKLSSHASIALSSSAAPRWSDYEAPHAQIVVSVFTEHDVVETIKYCNDHKLEFLAQTSGHGWANTWSLKPKDVIINLRGLNSVKVDKINMTATIGGGAIIKEIVDEVYKNEMHVVAGGCNCVSTGYILGGGVGKHTPNRLIRLNSASIFDV
ncbi:hypothetical protein AA313_de0202021 [Arthrobotrys entomopaga]|nr:hypothetical protein AA313_de0202021 [Arthrobotrys entomopaga]